MAGQQITIDEAIVGSYEVPSVVNTGYLRTNVVNTAADPVNVTLNGELLNTSLVAGTPNIVNISIPLANTEVSQVLSANVKRLEIRARQLNANLQFAFTAGQSNITFISIPGAATFSIDSLDLVGATLYIQSDKASTVVEVLEFI